MVAWRQTAEFVSRYFTKGRMAVVEGRLQIRDWTDKDGNKRTTAEVVADQVYFGDSKRDGDGGGYGNSGYSSGGYSGGGYASSGGYSAPAAPRHPPAFGVPCRAAAASSVRSSLTTTASCRFNFDRIWS